MFNLTIFDHGVSNIQGEIKEQAAIKDTKHPWLLSSGRLSWVVLRDYLQKYFSMCSLFGAGVERVRFESDKLDVFKLRQGKLVKNDPSTLKYELNSTYGH